MSRSRQKVWTLKSLKKSIQSNKHLFENKQVKKLFNRTAHSMNFHPKRPIPTHVVKKFQTLSGGKMELLKCVLSPKEAKCYLVDYEPSYLSPPVEGRQKVDTQMVNPPSRKPRPEKAAETPQITYDMVETFSTLEMKESDVPFLVFEQAQNTGHR